MVITTSKLRILVIFQTRFKSHESCLTSFSTIQRIVLLIHTRRREEDLSVENGRIIWWREGIKDGDLLEVPFTVICTSIT